MKACNNCGATLNDNAAFCTNCGSNLAPVYPTYQQPAAGMPVSVGGWIGRSLIPMIPIVGGIVYLIMLFIWSGDLTKEETFRNWAKAQLIVIAVAIVLTVVSFVAFGYLAVDLINSL